MTLALAILNDSGVVLAADGVGTWGVMIGAQQLPYRKLTVLGDRCACAEIGNLSITTNLVAALRASPLTSDPTMSRTAAQWLDVARDQIRDWTLEYLKHIVWNANLPIVNQIEDAYILLAGAASDRNFAYGIRWNGEVVEHANTPNYLVLGSGSTPARTYLNAWEYFAPDKHPVLNLEALAARVMDKVSRIAMEIGGEISLVAIHRDPAPDPPLREFGLDDAEVTTTIAHWELLEDGIVESLMVYELPTELPAIDAEPAIGEPPAVE